jgi:hypothetical protein
MLSDLQYVAVRRHKVISLRDIEWLDLPQFSQHGLKKLRFIIGPTGKN